MFHQILEKLRLKGKAPPQPFTPATRRRHTRYHDMRSDVVVGDRAYSVRDWSLGGVMFETLPDSRLVVGDKIRITLKFRFTHMVISLQHDVRVVRTSRYGVAAEFLSSSPETQRELRRVVDHYHAQRFLESQVH